jgi:hypothetical protein
MSVQISSRERADRHWGDFISAARALAAYATIGGVLSLAYW